MTNQDIMITRSFTVYMMEIGKHGESQFVHNSMPSVKKTNKKNPASLPTANVSIALWDKHQQPVLLTCQSALSQVEWYQLTANSREFS